MPELDLKEGLLGNGPVRPGHVWSQIWDLTVPNTISSVAMCATVVITTLSISHEDIPAHLAAFGLGALVANILGLTIGNGLTSVLETLVSQAFGAGNTELASVQLNRARFVVTLAYIPCCICLYKTDSILLLTQQSPEIAALAADYARATIFGLLPFFLYGCSSSFLRSSQRPAPPLLTNIVATFLHLAVTTYLVNVLKWGLWGAGLSVSINNIVRFFMLEVYLWRNPELLGHEFSKAMFTKLTHFLGLGIPSFVLVLVEWSAFEFQAFFAGWVSTEGLAAHVASVNVIAILFTIPNGVSQSLSTLVGASLGEANPLLAWEFTIKGGLLMLAIACTYASIVIVSTPRIAAIYSSDPSTLEILTPLLKYVAVFAVGDAMNSTQSGIIRGLGLQTRAAKYQTIAMYSIMLPWGYLAYPSYGVCGIWTGSIVGMFTSACLFFTIIKNADYTQCSRRAIAETRNVPSDL